MHRLQELVRLHRLGTGARETARLLKMSPNTERAYRRAFEAAGKLDGAHDQLPSLEELLKIVRDSSPEKASPKHETSSIAHWSPQVELLVGKGLTARPIYDRMRQEHDDFKGSYWAVKRLVSSIRRKQGVRARDVAIPVVTAPGEVAQVDFGYVGKLLCPEEHVLRRAWVFVMTLGHSRHMFAEVVFDQKLETWIALHQRAFKYFGGVPHTVVPDNLKTAVIRAAFAVDGDCSLNRTYRELARHYGFKVDPTPPYSPKKKGKVESSVKYVKRNALAGRQGEPIDDVNKGLLRWLKQIAGTRTHGTTGRQPLEMFHEEEQSELHRLPKQPYERVIWKKAKVHQDTHVSYAKRLYSVPWKWVGKSVWIRATDSTVAVFGEDVRIATHTRKGRGPRSTYEPHLPEHRRDRRHRSESYWRDRAAVVGPETAGLVAEIFSSDDVLSQLRKVQAIVTHLEGFPKERAEAAARRARYFGTYTYQGVKSILKRALDMEPLPAVVVTPPNEAQPRFARNIAELIAQKLEVNDEPH